MIWKSDWSGSSSDYSYPSSNTYSSPAIAHPVKKKPNIFCTECGFELKSAFKFCPACGLSIDKMISKKDQCECGAILKEGIKFCYCCGKKKPATS